jgi:hypothetical protein
MTNAYRDENSKPTIITALNTDGATIVRVKINSVNHGLKTSNGSTGSDHGPVNALTDENGVYCFQAVSSSDGVTPVSLYSDSSGNLLVQST